MSLIFFPVIYLLNYFGDILFLSFTLRGRIKKIKFPSAPAASTCCLICIFLICIYIICISRPNDRRALARRG